MADMKPDERNDDSALRARAQRLGGRAAERLDVERIAEQVVDRLRQDRARGIAHRSHWVRVGWLRVAAAIVVLAGAGLLLRRTFQAPAPQAPFVSDELQGLSTTELRDVLGSLDRTLETPVPDSSTENLNDLTTEQLEAVLQSLEG
jgi:hypothetical protein